MEQIEAARAAAALDLRADSGRLERQLRMAEKHYAAARALADQSRDQWRSLSARPTVRPELVLAARAKFEAVVARCRRLMSIIDDLESRIDD
jgi:hypothetical protein